MYYCICLPYVSSITQLEQAHSVLLPSVVALSQTQFSPGPTLGVDSFGGHQHLNGYLTEWGSDWHLLCYLGRKVLYHNPSFLSVALTFHMETAERDPGV